MGNFCMTFKLKTEKYQEDILNKRFEISRKMYNSLVTVTQKRYKEMIKTKKYRNIKSELKEMYKSQDNNQGKTKTHRQNKLYKQLNEIYKIYKLNEYSFHKDVKGMQKQFKKNIDSFTAQKLATHLWSSYEKLFFGDGEKIHYKKYDTLNSLEGKSNSTGIRFKDDNLIWNGLKIPVQIDHNNPYENQAMQEQIAYCRITRKYVKGRYKFYVQIVFKGQVPMKIDKATGENKRKKGHGKVGIDIGTQTIAIASPTEVKLLELADKVQNIEKEKRKILRCLDRSKRSSNPDNFNEGGTIKKGIPLNWNFSNKYKTAKRALKELYRKQKDIRKLQHEILANEIIKLGNEFYVEKMSFKGLQSKAKETKKNDKGKYIRKKRFGKSLANKAPAMLLTILDRKLNYHGLKLNKINTHKVKASQYNHTNEVCTKKSLSKRWNEIEDEKVQRDLYSAFLIMNVNKDLESINNEQCTESFPRFIKLHNIEIDRLKTVKLTPALKNVI